MANLKERIIAYITYKGISIQAFEKSVGLSNGAVSKMGDNTRTSTLDRISNRYSDLNRAWLLTGEGSMLVGKGEDVARDESSEWVSVKFYPDMPVSAGDIEQYIDNETNVGEIRLKSGLNGAKALFPVVGCSMMPTIKPGDWVGVKEVDYVNGLIDPDKIFMLITRDNQRMIKHIASVNHQEGYVTLASDNSAYKPFTVPFDMIVRVFQIVCHLEML